MGQKLGMNDATDFLPELSLFLKNCTERCGVTHAGENDLCPGSVVPMARPWRPYPMFSESVYFNFANRLFDAFAGQSSQPQDNRWIGGDIDNSRL